METLQDIGTQMATSELQVEILVLKTLVIG
jgi:hypothetical protein